MSITCGIDWAEAHHDVALSDEQGQIVARLRGGVDNDLPFPRWHPNGSPLNEPSAWHVPPWKRHPA